ncbi:MAG: FAD binding domain-containing protein [Terriglobia bacterium]
MIPQPFDYHAPKSFAEAAALLAEGGESKILAGGHSLLPMMKLGLASPRRLIDLRNLADLRYIREAGEQIEIGALATHFEIESSALLKEKCPLLPETAREIGDVQVRNRGTLGGSLAHADPAADWPAAILALDAEIEARGAGGSRWIAAEDFFVDLLTTALRADEILAGIRFRAPATRSGSAYVKLHHPASGYAMAGAAAIVGLNDAGKIDEVRVAITGIGPKAYRARNIESMLHGKAPGAIQEAAALAAEGIDVNGDLYASADYRSHLARVYARRALEAAARRARAAPESAS